SSSHLPGDRRGWAGACAETEAAQVLAGPHRDRQRHFERAWIQVLLDDDEQITVERVECLDHRPYGRRTVWRLHTHSTLDRLAERDAFVTGHPRDLRVNLFDVDVAHAVGILANERDTVAGSVRHMARVQAQ